MKETTQWQSNAAANLNRYKYNDATIKYNEAARTYSGIVLTNLNRASVRTPASWHPTP
jgi:hypothetical protein